MNGLTVLIVAAGAVLFFGGIAIAARVMDRDDRRDPFGPEDDPGQAPGFGDMPPEIAHEPGRSIHELPALGDAVWHPRPSPAAQLASPRAPLPGPAYAAANGLPHHFAEWLSDTFVGDVIAIRGHGGTAGVEAEI